MTGRLCHAIDIDPAYIDVAVKRWQAFTGKEAVLDGDSRSFTEIGVERGIHVDAMPARNATVPTVASLDFDDWGTAL